MMTLEEALEEITRLQRENAELRRQLATRTVTTGPWCRNFERRGN